MSRVIGVVSGKGGVGKTTVVTNLATILSKVFYKNVLVFDSNINTSHLGLHLGIYEDLPITLIEILRREVPVTRAIYQHSATGIYFMPTPLRGSDIDLTKEDCLALVNGLRNRYDMIILDCAPGLGREVIVAVSAIDDAIVVTTPDLPAVTDALKTINIVEKLGKRVLGIVVNRYRNKKYELTPDEIRSACNYNIIATIPEDKRIPESISEGIPVVMGYPHSPASKEIKKLAAYLIGERYASSGIFQTLKSRLTSFIKISPKQPELETYHAPKLKEEATTIEVPKPEVERQVPEKLESFIKENKDLYLGLRDKVDDLRIDMLKLNSEIKRIKEYLEKSKWELGEVI